MSVDNRLAVTSSIDNPELPTTTSITNNKEYAGAPEGSTQYQRRFRGTQTLYGSDKFSSFERAHIIVIGIGGVGSWAAEALARTAIGEMTLIDLDVLVASNVNRQLPALDATFGRSKIEVIGERAKQINPNIKLNLIDDFLTAENVTTLLPNKDEVRANTQRQVVVLDCTDDMSAKLSIALHCRFNKLKLICAGGAGGKTDPLKVTVSDLKDSYQDPLLARLRAKLRHEHNINKSMKEKFGIRCVYSTQPPVVNNSVNNSVNSNVKNDVKNDINNNANSDVKDDVKNDVSSNANSNAACQIGGLHCGGYGSAVVVTSVVAMVMVSETLALLK